MWRSVLKYVVSCLQYCPYVSGSAKSAAPIKWEAVSDLWLIGVQGDVCNNPRLIALIILHAEEFYCW